MIKKRKTDMEREVYIYAFFSMAEKTIEKFIAKEY